VGQDRDEILTGAKTRMLVHRRWIALMTVIAAAVTGGIALAAVPGQPVPWQLGLQQSVSPVMDTVVWLHNFLLYIITAITLFVLALLVYVIVRFNAGSNPIPSKTTHNTVIEVLWTVVPVLILVAIAVPSFQLLFFQQTIPPADLTIKATGKQWFWSYAYPDNGGFEFDSLMIREDRLRRADQPRLLAVDNEVVVPVNKVVRVQVTAADVLHAFAVPSFGVKIDAVPGRLNELWFKATREGIYYGQCSELCGQDHYRMPIQVRVVNDAEFAAWIEQAKKKFARSDDPKPTAVAAVKEKAAE
jgi:cytochrome c oxidase subunit 2